MRVITGSAKRVQLSTPPMQTEQTKPTSDRVKESVFSMIQFDIEGRRVLDLFAGTGQMGIEALSRGASFADFVDSSPDAVALVRENLKRTKLFELSSVTNSEFRIFIKNMEKRKSAPYDLIFLDPPYSQSQQTISDCVSLLDHAALVSPGAYIVCESGVPLYFEKSGYKILRENKYGTIYITLYEKEIENL